MIQQCQGVPTLKTEWTVLNNNFNSLTSNSKQNLKDVFSTAETKIDLRLNKNVHKSTLWKTVTKQTKTAATTTVATTAMTTTTSMTTTRQRRLWHQLQRWQWQQLQRQRRRWRRQRSRRLCQQLQRWQRQRQRRQRQQHRHKTTATGVKWRTLVQQKLS